MTLLFRTCCRLVLPAVLLVANAAQAQLLPARPLSSDPARAIYAPSATELRALPRGTTALPLPFFDDFTSPLEGAPKVLNWVPGGGALVNNRFAIRPLTRGTASLDGLKASGDSYSGIVTGTYGLIDTLTSQPVNLAGLTATDRVALSFAWQAGSIVGTPHASTFPGSTRQPVSLELLVRTNAGVWESAWRYESVGRLTGFKQQVVLLSQAKYLHGAFQFRFLARGNASDNSDTWNVDYVLLDRGRAAGLADTTFVDVATSAGLRGANPSGGLRSPLRRFTAMPVWQFNAAPAAASELSRRLGVNMTNLRPGTIPLITGFQGSVRELTTGTSFGNWMQRTKPLFNTPRHDSVYGDASRRPIPTTPTAKRLRYTVALNSQETTPLTLPNDTIFRDVDLSNYYAYDDGKFENITQLPAYSTGLPAALAYRFDLNQPDYVRGLRLYPVFTASDRNPRSVTINVWDDVNGSPAATPRAFKSTSIPYPLPNGWDYIEVSFDPPVPVTGSFYVGYSQPSLGKELHYGLDLNSTFPARHLMFRNNAGVWDTANFPLGRGAVMMRPVMSNNVATATASARDAAAFSLYPNPTRGSVTVSGPAFAHAEVLDAVGRLAWSQPADQAGRAILQLPSLPAGVYTVRLTLPTGVIVGRRLLVSW